MAKSVALLLGAGFSRWSADLPVVGSLFDFQIDIINRQEEQRLEVIRTLKNNWDNNHPGSHPEEFIAFILNNGLVRQRLYLIWYITRRLTNPFLAKITRGIQTLQIDESKKWLNPGIQKANLFFKHVLKAKIAGVITPNYDLLIEYALGTGGFNYGEVGEILEGRGKNPIFPWQKAYPPLRGSLSVAKVHGSLSWYKGTHYTDGRFGLRGKADIVPPIPEKTRPEELKSVWKLAEKILHSANSALVFGFAFNPYDVALIELLATGKTISDVLLIDPKPQVARALQVWPGAEVTVCEPPSSEWNCIDKWLASEE